MASFLAAILSSRDQGPLVTNALQLVELLLVKMPDAYQYFFRREGVMHEIEAIAASPLVGSVSKSKRPSPSRTPQIAAPAVTADQNSAEGSPGLTRALQHHVDGAAPAAVPPPRPILSPSEAQAQDMITLRARHLRDEYAGADSEPALRARLALDRIEELVTRPRPLPSSPASSPPRPTNPDSKAPSPSPRTGSSSPLVKPSSTCLPRSNT